MSSDHEAKPMLSRLLDRFLDERNIKWVLTTGMLILFASSAMLVSTHWETLTPLWKHFVLIGYTAAIATAAEFAYHRLGLQKTGSVLMALSVLLFPIPFLALQWMGMGDRIGVARGAAQGLLFIISLTLAAGFSRRIFEHFLRTPQPTFLASYLLLCVAGALPKATTPTVAFGAALVLWGVFTIGAAKAARHFFWLAEEHRLPRIFPFFPIALLGAQTVALAGLKLGGSLPVDGIGFWLALASIPILLTADAAARVHEQRTGGLQRPLPLSILVPMLTALCAVALGISLSGAQLLVGAKPMMLAPTAAASAVVLMLVARRTKQAAFVYGGLFAATLAYNFSPVFFADFARSVVHSSAAAVQEKRLPLAFYGLTYVPFLLGLMVASKTADLRRSSLFAVPTRQFALLLSCVLLLVSYGHSKAILPVGTAMTVAFTIQTILWRDRRIVGLGVAAFLTSAIGVLPFANGVLSFALPPQASLLFLASAASVLALAGAWIDRWAETLHPVLPAKSKPIQFCQSTSLGVAVLLAALMLMLPASKTPDVYSLASVAAATLLLVLHAFRTMRPTVGVITLAYVHGMLWKAGIAEGFALSTVASLDVLVLGAQWGAARLLDRIPSSRVARAFGPANDFVSHWGLGVYLAGLVMPAMTLDVLNCFVAGLTIPLWPVAWLLLVAWGFESARRSGRMEAAGLATLGAFGFASSTLIAWLGPESREWIPLVWSATAVLGVGVHEWIRRSIRNRPASLAAQSGWPAIGVPLEFLSMGMLAACSVLTLCSFATPLRLAGLVGFAGLFAAARLRGDKHLATLSLIAGNWQVFLLVIGWICPKLVLFGDLLDLDSARPMLTLAALASASVLAWSFTDCRSRVDRVSVDAHFAFMRLIAGCGLLISMAQRLATPFEVGMAVAAFLMLAAAEFMAAYRNQDSLRVWIGQALLGALFGYLVLVRAISLDHRFGMFVVFGLGVAATYLSGLLGSWERTRIFAGPIGSTGRCLPMLAVLMAVGGFELGRASAWMGADSLVMFLAAGFYFYLGLSKPDSKLLVLSVLILNGSLAILWRRLHVSDPQLFLVPVGLSVLALVELLKKEIPAWLHNPLRYAGALVIVTSPVGEIVHGSWLHIFTLMVAAVGLVLLGVATRTKATMFTGQAFLLADLVAMVVRGSVDQPSLLWVAGLALGAGVVALGAVCEKHREELLQRVRLVAAQLETWV